MRYALLLTIASCCFFSAAPSLPNEDIQELKTSEVNIPSNEASQVPTDDHGYTFPIEDLVEHANNKDDKFYVEFLNMLATLGIVIAVILFAAWMLRRLLNTRLEQINTTSTIKVIERRSLSPKTAIYLLEIYGKTIAIAESQNGITSLAEFPGTFLAPEEEETIPSSFNQILERTKSKEKKQ